MLKHVPNLLTISNLICGCIALYFTFHNQMVFAAYLIGLAAIFDFMDGAAARILKVPGPVGKESDSLADMVSFGVVPGSVVFHLIESSSWSTYSFVSLLIPALSAYRLAKFNVDERQTRNFIGLPTPANCLFFASFPLILSFQEESNIALLISMPEIVVSLTVLMSLVMVSEIPLFSLKFKNLSYAQNKLRFLFIGTGILLTGLLKFSAIPIVVLLYIFFSMVFKPASD